MDQNQIGKASTFRLPCFSIEKTNANEDEEIGLSQILNYTNKYKRDILFPNNNENSSDGNIQMRDVVLLDNSGDETSEDDSGPTNQEQTQQKNELNSIDNDISIDQAIRMLEPHLINFRELCSDDGDYINDDDDDVVANIPPPLIRVARFFPFKWIPIKEALLRSPQPSEVRSLNRI